MKPKQLFLPGVRLLTTEDLIVFSPNGRSHRERCVVQNRCRSRASENQHVPAAFRVERARS